ncbi:MAG: hypothetical protein JXR34_12285 [Bacteroidales bacterium]|nr:hypothetical protein [Bacteroidales bacterium]
MPDYSQKSQHLLATAHLDLQIVFNEVIKTWDCTVLYGHRSQKEQFELFKNGREWDGLVWKETGVTVTDKDGYQNKSDHNYIPSRAVDVVPYPIDWKDTKRMIRFIGFVQGVAARLKAEGRITHDIISGADWDNDTYMTDHQFTDLPHFFIKL